MKWLTLLYFSQRQSCAFRGLQVAALGIRLPYWAGLSLFLLWALLQLENIHKKIALLTS
jgi:hypothetical protein